MDGFKEFQDRSLDAAISSACVYFDARREQLEIEIIQDARAGIFGLGARKAIIRARKVRLRDAVESLLGIKSLREQASEVSGAPAPETGREKEKPTASPQKSGQNAAPKEAAPARDRRRGDRRREQAAGRAEAAAGESAVRAGEKKAGRAASPLPNDAAEQTPAAVCQPEGSQAAEAAGQAGQGKNAAQQPKGPKGQRPARGQQPQGQPGEKSRSVQEAAKGVDALTARTGTEKAVSTAEDEDAEKSLEQIDTAVACETALEAVSRILVPLTGEETAQCSAGIEDGRIRIVISGLEDCGQLIGRDGLTLAAVQCIVSRIVSKKVGAVVRVQLEVGDYRQRQDEKLRELAFSLAEKVRQTGRSFSTRPMSSYHRRVIHMCLRDVEGIQTRSSGEGAMKRVVVMRRKSGAPKDTADE